MSRKPTYEELQKRVLELEKLHDDYLRVNALGANPQAQAAGIMNPTAMGSLPSIFAYPLHTHLNIEQKLIEERQRLYTLFDALPVYIHLQTVDYQIIFANQYFKTHVGDWVGRTCYECFHDLSEPCPVCPALRVLNEGGFDIRQWRSPAGRYFEVYNYPFTDVDGSPLIMELGIDITNRVRTEKEQKKLEERLRELATTDPLTGAYNRRHFAYLAEKELQRCLRYGLPYSLCMLDIDHFKRVNDAFGHEAGDMVLKQLVDFFVESLRVTDIFGRWGGEEFAFVLVQDDLDQARATCERLRLGIADLVFKSPCGHNFSITASIGLTSHCGPEISVETLLRMADTALYSAKAKGRNQVVCCGG